jgi:Fe(3+) dicitrate transport protein
MVPFTLGCFVASCVDFRGFVADESGGAIHGAVVEYRCGSSAAARRAETTFAGEFQLKAPEGLCEISINRPGFGLLKATVEVPGEGRFVLMPATMAQEILVSANLIAGTPEIVARTPGSVDFVDSLTLRGSRVFGMEEALRKVSGIYARPEEGFSLRPNIGVRGLNPTRSSSLLLLEDGVPLAYAPYGDNASYYHPPVDRFESIEVVKGSGQIGYGPRTVGGVVNYVTPPAPDKPSGSVSLTGGNRDYMNAHMRYGGTWKGYGMLLDGIRKQGEGARDNVRSGLTDLNAKMLAALTARQALALKTNYYAEDSRVTYSGLRLAEWLENPRQNPFRNDSFEGRRWGASAVHTAAVSPSTIFTTTAYGSLFERHWWRQSSNSAQRPNDAADPACGGLANLHASCGNEGRLRHYSAWGVEPRGRWTGALAGMRTDFDFGLRAHYEIQERIQKNGPLPLSRDGAIVENNQRSNQAYSGFLQPRLQLGDFIVTPGLRLENVRYQRTNRLFGGGTGIAGETELTEAIPGIGVAWNPSPRLTVFSGLHRGFAPPRTEDIIGNDGGFVELDPELSWNYEAGVRVRPVRNLALDATHFRMDYSNQIIPASLAGGVGSVLTSAGRTLHQGAEVSGRWEARNVLGTGNSMWLRSAWTWLPGARFAGTRYSNVSGYRDVLITGNRLPYASEHLLNANVGWVHRTGVNFLIEMVHTGRQFSDDLNTVNSSEDGQRGLIPGNAVWNAAVNVPLEGRRTTLFFAVKNVFDRLVLVDRSRGMLPGSPRLVHAGLSFAF